MVGEKVHIFVEFMHNIWELPIAKDDSLDSLGDYIYSLFRGTTQIVQGS